MRNGSKAPWGRLCVGMLAMLAKVSYCYSILIEIEIKYALPVNFLQIAIGKVPCFGTALINS